MLSVKESANQVWNVLVCDESALQGDERDIGLWSAARTTSVKRDYDSTTWRAAMAISIPSTTSNPCLVAN
jgi:hypothetical protein